MDTTLSLALLGYDSSIGMENFEAVYQTHLFGVTSFGNNVNGKWR